MTIRELVDKASLVDYVAQYGDMEWRGREVWMCSPLSSKDTDPSFSVDPEQNCFFDYSANYGGNILNFIMAKDKCSFRDAVDKLKTWLGVKDEIVYTTLPIIKTLRSYRPRPEQKAKAEHTIIPQSEIERYRVDEFPYWQDEGITIDSIRQWQIGIDRRSDCIMIPIWDQEGNLINFLCRTINPLAKQIGIPKYIYKNKLGRLDFFWGWYQNREAIAKKKEVLLVEGCKSVMKLCQWGYKNCAAILTSHLGDEQLRILIKCGFDVVFLLDHDIDPRKDENIQKLKRFCRTYICRDTKGLTDEKDAPCDVDKSTFEAILAGRRLLR